MKKILLEFEEIEEKFTQIFLDIPEDIKPELTDLKFTKSYLSLNDVSKLEVLLKLRLPKIFKQMILRYDFGDLTIGRISFGNKENYLEYLLKRNTDKIDNIYFPVWWRHSKSLLKYISIADTDGYVILLDTENEKIMAYSRIESCENAKLIAFDFEYFVRATATIFIKNQSEERDIILDNIPFIVTSVANNNFWQEII